MRTYARIQKCVYVIRECGVQNAHRCRTPVVAAAGVTAAPVGPSGRGFRRHEPRSPAPRLISASKARSPSSLPMWRHRQQKNGLCY